MTPMKLPPTQLRWTTLAALIAAVLALHLLLLGQANPLAASPVPHWHSAEAPAERTAAPNSPPSAAPEATAAPALRATMHTVRWISPPAAPAATTHTAGHSTPPRQPQPAPPEAPQPANPQAREHHAARLPAPEPTPAPALAAPTATEPETARAPSTPATEPNDRPAPETQGHEDTPASEAPTTVVALLTTPTPTPAPAETRTQAASPASPPTQAAAQRSAASTSALPPASVQLLYDVSGSAKGLNYRASSTLDWAQADGRYNARLEMRIALLGSRVQTSTGRVTANGLLPERFSDKSRSERAAHFDRTRQTIRFSNNQPDASLQAGAQDRLSLFMQLAGLLQAQASAYPVGQVISLQVAGTSDAEVWRFRVAEDDTLTLPVGTLRARHLVREPREPRDSLVELWFAPERGHLPVRIRITQENGDRVDQQLRQMLPAAQTP